MAERHRINVICLTALICASCSGGGSDGPSGSVVTPSPAPSATATATPTPTPSGPPNLLNLTQNQQFEGYTGDNGYWRVNPSGAVTYDGNASSGVGSPVFYSAATRSLTFYSVLYAIPGMSSTGPTSLFRDSAASDATYSVYRQRSGGVDYSLRQLNIGPSNPTMPLVYANMAILYASTIDPADGLLKVAVSPTAFGIRFDPYTASLTGAVTYQGILLGHARGVGGDHVYDVTGTVRFDVNLGTTDFVARVQMTGKDDVTGQVVDLGTLEWTPTRPRGVLDYLIGSHRDGHRLQAHLAGPAGEELLGSFDAQVPDPLAPGVRLKVNGMYVGRR